MGDKQVASLPNRAAVEDTASPVPTFWSGGLYRVLPPSGWCGSTQGLYRDGAKKSALLLGSPRVLALAGPERCTFQSHEATDCCALHFTCCKRSFAECKNLLTRILR